MRSARILAPSGSGGPFPVTLPPSTTVDFIVCNSLNDYPACLRK